MSQRPHAPSALRSTLAALLLCAWELASAQQADQEPLPAESDKSYWLPALEIITFDLLLSNYNRAFSGSSDYDVSGASIRRNLRGPWVTDNDPFKVNQFAHPYQGSLYHGAGRSLGLNYWEASALTFAGSVWWEITGEQTPPAKNDQIASGIAGSFLGEALFRMSHLVSDRSDIPDGWRQGLAALVSPPVDLNRRAFGSRFERGFFDHDPAYYGRVHLGATHALQKDFDTKADFKPNAAQVDFALDYGLPGRPGYTYSRPFDYFNFHALLSSANGVENLSTRGLLLGTDYPVGDNYRGIWGLYATYDYLSPQIFHVSTTALSIGTTGQWWASQTVALQGTALIGLGYSAASTARRLADTPEYHYGTSPRVGMALRVISGDRAAIDVSARMVSLGSIAHRAGGRDDITRVDTAFTWRIQGQHAVGVNYVWSHRSADFSGSTDRRQTLGMVGIYYTLLGQHGLSAVEWRAPDAGQQR